MSDIQVSEFTRKDLEIYIQSLPSTDGYRIVGSERELKKLNLSHKTMVFGVSCVVVEKGKVVDKKKISKERPQRGEPQPFGINGVLNKPK